jgi:excisionase family DNA binding protein
MRLPKPLTTLEGRKAYTFNEACVLLGVGRDSLFSAINAGHIVAQKVGRRTVITPRELERFLANAPRSRGYARSKAA